MNRPDYLKEKYNLEKHAEGGWFSEVYTSPSHSGGRAYMGSIYYLLEADDISHFHQIDCDEIWYYHEGSALLITIIIDGKISREILGAGEKQSAMAVIPGNAIFAAELLDKDSYSFVSCATTPQFRYDRFRLPDSEELQSICPEEYEEISRLVLKD